MNKSLIILLVIALAVAGIIYWIKSEGPLPDLVVETYFHNLDIPLYTPIGQAYEVLPPVYPQTAQMRHFIVVVNVPAKRLLAVDQSENESDSQSQQDKGNDYLMKTERKYPKFVLIEKKGNEVKPRGVFAWPPKGDAMYEEDFRNPEQWFPLPQENPTRRYRLALYFRKPKADFDTPFKIKMDDDITVEVTDDKYEVRLWK
jgi:hypothetical protein